MEQHLNEEAAAPAAAGGIALQWKKAPPSIGNLTGRPEEYFWARGGNFNRPIMVRATSGVNSSMVDGRRQFRAEINFKIYADGYPSHIWAADLQKWPSLGQLEWAGPVPRPVDDQ